MKINNGSFSLFVPFVLSYSSILLDIWSEFSLLWLHVSLGKELTLFIEWILVSAGKRRTSWDRDSNKEIIYAMIICVKSNNMTISFLVTSPSQKKQPIPLYMIISVRFLSIFKVVGWFNSGKTRVFKCCWLSWFSVHWTGCHPSPLFQYSWLVWVIYSPVNGKITWVSCLRTGQKLHFSQLLNQHGTTSAVTSTAQWADCFWECSDQAGPGLARDGQSFTNPVQESTWIKRAVSCRKMVIFLIWYYHLKGQNL